MPELTEVLILSHYLLTKIKNKYIESIEILGGRYTHQTFSGLANAKKHTPLKIIDIDTKGKLFWFILETNLNEPIYLICNFGLTGVFLFNKTNSARVKFNLSDGIELYYTDQRNFGIMQFTNDISILNKKIETLARDYIKEPYTDKEFYDEFINFINEKKSRKNKLIIKFLMDQNKSDTLGSGIGNYISVEALYMAKISPHRTLGSHNEKEIKKLNNSIKKVIKLSYVSNKTGYMEYLIDYIDKHKMQIITGKFPDYLPEIKIKKNQSFEFQVYQHDEDKHGNPVKADKIIPSRTTYLVPAVQK